MQVIVEPATHQKWVCASKECDAENIQPIEVVLGVLNEK